jgi:alpha-D-xyloside xylohydrolase
MSLQAVDKIRVYSGADGKFTLFSDDGTTYAYEKGAGFCNASTLG